MVKLPSLKNPAAPKKAITAEEAEARLLASAPVTNDSEDGEDDQYEIDSTDDPDDPEDQDTESDEENSENEAELSDTPNAPTPPVSTKTAKGKSNLAPQQLEHLNYIKSLGQNQGKGVSSLISLAEEMVIIGHNGIFESKQLKDLYITFRKESNTAAGKNREFNDGADDHTLTSNTSKLRSFFKVGEKHGTDGWGKMLKVARDIHVNILRSKDERKLLRSKQLIPTYEALVKVASEQMKKEKDTKGVAHEKYPKLLTADQIREVFIDPNKQEVEPTVVDVITAAAKAIERVINGKVDPVTGTYTRESFNGVTYDENSEDDNSAGFALHSSLSWVLNAGERFKVGFIKNREREIAEAKAAADERKRKHNERIAREEAERQANKAKKEAARLAAEAAKKLEAESKAATAAA